MHVNQRLQMSPPCLNEQKKREFDEQSCKVQLNIMRGRFHLIALCCTAHVERKEWGVQEGACTLSVVIS